MEPSSLIVAAAGRPYPGETVSGDAWRVDWHEGTCRIALVDGLGHGPAAEAAAEAALETLATWPGLQPGEAFQKCHEALASTRGAAMLIARIDPVAGRLQYAAVGNVEGRLWHLGRQERLVAYRGIVGATLPRIRTLDLALGPGWTLVIHTDGLRSAFDLGSLPSALMANPQSLADGLLLGWSRVTDDATVVVASPG